MLRSAGKAQTSMLKPLVLPHSSTQYILPQKESAPTGTPLPPPQKKKSIPVAASLDPSVRQRRGRVTLLTARCQSDRQSTTIPVTHSLWTLK